MTEQTINQTHPKSNPLLIAGLVFALIGVILTILGIAFDLPSWENFLAGFFIGVGILLAIGAPILNHVFVKANRAYTPKNPAQVKSVQFLVIGLIGFLIDLVALVLHTLYDTPLWVLILGICCAVVGAVFLGLAIGTSLRQGKPALRPID
jgi:hydrogenase/urease accessory protein HupE